MKCCLLRRRLFSKNTAVTCFTLQTKAIPSLETSVNSHPSLNFVSQKTVESSLPKAEFYFRVKKNCTYVNSFVYFNFYFGPLSSSLLLVSAVMNLRVP